MPFAFGGMNIFQNIATNEHFFVSLNNIVQYQKKI